MAIDGSKFKAVNNRDKNFTAGKLKARMQHLEESIARYLADLDRADREPTAVSEARAEHLQHKVETIRAHLQELKQRGEQLAESARGADLAHRPGCALHGHQCARLWGRGL